MSDIPGGPGTGRGVPVWVFAACLVAVAVVVGSAVWVLRTPAAPPGPSSPAATSTVPSSPATQSEEPTSVAPSVESTALPYTPGPNESGEKWAYITKLASKGGYVYATVDYIVIGENPDGGWEITNDNPKLRTFPLAAACPCRYRVEGGSDLSAPLSPADFRAAWSSAPEEEMIRNNPYKLTLKHGVITKLDNEWLP